MIDPQCVRWLGEERCQNLATQVVDDAPMCDAHADEVRQRRARGEAILREYQHKQRRVEIPTYHGTTQASKTMILLDEIRQWIKDNPSEDGAILVDQLTLEKLLDLIGIQQEQIDGLERVVHYVPRMAGPSD